MNIVLTKEQASEILKELAEKEELTLEELQLRRCALKVLKTKLTKQFSNIGQKLASEVAEEQND